MAPSDRSDTKPDGASVIALSILLVFSLTMYFFVKHVAPLIVSTGGKLFLSHENSSKAYWLTD